MFEKITPEQAGISSSAVEKYISVIEKYGVVPHSVLMMKGTSLFAEYYWSPFHKDSLPQGQPSPHVFPDQILRFHRHWPFGRRGQVIPG